jgi:hypothetical protein
MRLGINYSDQWGKKLTITGSYFFNNSINDNLSAVNTQTFFNPKDLYSRQTGNSVTENTNHRVNLRLEYKIDSANSIFFIPSLNFQKNNSSSTSSLENYYGLDDSLNSSISRINSDRNGFNLRNNICTVTLFQKEAVPVSLGFNTIYTKNDGENITKAQYHFYDTPQDSIQNQFYDNATNGHTIEGTVAYTEPIGKKGQLQVDYRSSVQKNNADQQTYSFDGVKYSEFDTSLSNRFDNTISTNNAGLNYRLNPSRDEQFAIGVNFQNSKLESQRIFPTASSVNQAFSNILPNAMYRKKLSAASNIRVFYRASTNFPSVNQLQDVVNLTNPLRITSGNP